MIKTLVLQIESVRIQAKDEAKDEVKDQAKDQAKGQTTTTTASLEVKTLPHCLSVYIAMTSGI